MRKTKVFVTILFIIILTICIYPNVVQASEDIIVMLDPGHGGSDPGTYWGNLKEKDINWKIASRVKEILDNTPGITGILTRNENEKISFPEMGEKVSRNNADLLVSFHINSSPSSIVRGAEVYITANTNQERFNKNSKILAEDVLANLRNVGVPSFSSLLKIKYSTDGELYSDGFLSDYYAMIRYPMYYGVPGVLIEHCFMSNEKDRNQFLSNDSSINAMAEADAKAIIENKELFRIDKTKNSIGLGIKKLEIGTTANNQQYIWGEVHINNWINGMIKKPGQLPKIRLVSTDRAKSYEMWVANREGNLYYFDSLIEPIDRSYEYYIEVESQEKNIIPVYNTGNIEISNKTLGKNEIVWIEDGKIKFKPDIYKADMGNEIIAMYLNKNSQGQYYISGNAYITEWIDGTKWSIPEGIPNITIKTTEGEQVYNCWVSNIGGNKYYFDSYIEGIDISKQYVIEIELANKANISENKKGNAYFPKDIDLGNYKQKEMQVQKSIISFIGKEYKADLGHQLLWLELHQNEQGKSYINGNIYITEWIDGTKWSVPNGMPSIVIKTTEGIKVYEAWVTNIGGNKYYFDCYIEEIDTTKEYEIEINLTNEKNTSTNKSAKINFGHKQQIGQYREHKVELENNIIRFINTVIKLEIMQEEIIKEEIIQEEIIQEEIIDNEIIKETIIEESEDEIIVEKDTIENEIVTDIPELEEQEKAE